MFVCLTGVAGKDGTRHGDENGAQVSFTLKGLILASGDSERLAVKSRKSFMPFSNELEMNES